MAFNGSGTFSIINAFVPGTTILSSAVNQNYTDIASGLSNCMCKDGQQIAAANQPMGNFRLTNLHAGSARSDSINLGQVQDAILNWIVAGSTGSVNAIIATYSPPLSALIDGQFCSFRATGSNTSTTPTFNPNGLGANTITRAGGSALFVGDIPGNLAECVLRYNLANTRWELVNPAIVTAVPATTIDALTLKSSPTSTDELAAWDKTGSVASKVTVGGVLSAATAPTVQRFTSGSATYTPTAGMVRIKVRMCGGGGGGGAAVTNAGTNGNNTSFAASTWTCIGGTGGAAAAGGGGAGGTGGVNGTGTLVMRIPGGAGNGGGSVNGDSGFGGQGGSNPFGGGGGGGGSSQAGQAGGTNTGAGGGGGSANTTSGSGGGSGEYVEFWMTSAQVGASQTYVVGGTANGGSAGSFAGGNGAAGQIVVEEFYI